MGRRRIISLTFVLAAGVAGFSLTGGQAQKVQKINAPVAETQNVGWTAMGINPLLEEEYPGLSEAVARYYGEQGEASDFVEAYVNIRVYTKKGKYPGSYLAFVKYDMKIKDIYTAVPGLGTFYVEKDETGGAYKIDAGAAEQNVGEEIMLLSAHEDVQELLAETTNEYTAAVQSDALLREALADLKNAYEESAGS